MNQDFSFTKQERLKSQIVIGALFKGGQSYVAYPFRVVWIPRDPNFVKELVPSLAQVAISGPKKNFKTATARNLLTRRIREAWRLNKHTFYEKIAISNPQGIQLMLMYIAKETLPYVEIEHGVKKVGKKF